MAIELGQTMQVVVDIKRSTGETAIAKGLMGKVTRIRPDGAVGLALDDGRKAEFFRHEVRTVPKAPWDLGEVIGDNAADLDRAAERAVAGEIAARFDEWLKIEKARKATLPAVVAEVWSEEAKRLVRVDGGRTGLGGAYASHWGGMY